MVDSGSQGLPSVIVAASQQANHPASHLTLHTDCTVQEKPWQVNGRWQTISSLTWNWTLNWTWTKEMIIIIIMKRKEMVVSNMALSNNYTTILWFYLCTVTNLYLQYCKSISISISIPRNTIYYTSYHYTTIPFQCYNDWTWFDLIYHPPQIILSFKHLRIEITTEDIKNVDWLLSLSYSIPTLPTYYHARKQFKQ